jgi:peroxiredoxin
LLAWDAGLPPIVRLCQRLTTATATDLMKWRSLEEGIPSEETRTLREIFAVRKELIAKYVPAETLGVHARAIAELRSRRLAANSLAVGAQAPAFTLPDYNDKPVASAKLLSSGRLVVCFFRGRWDPFCCGQMEAMNGVLPEVERAGAALVAISPQTLKQSFFMVDQHRLRFPLLRDAGNRVARQFGLAYRVPNEQQAIYRRAFVNLPFVNGDEGWELPIPASYVIDIDGTVLYASANEDYTARPEPGEVVERLR